MNRIGKNDYNILLFRIRMMLFESASFHCKSEIIAELDTPSGIIVAIIIIFIFFKMISATRLVKYKQNDFDNNTLPRLLFCNVCALRTC